MRLTIRKISIWSHPKSSQPPTPDIGISVLRCRRPIPSGTIGVAGPRWPTLNPNHRRDETRTGQLAQEPHAADGELTRKAAATRDRRADGEPGAGNGASSLVASVRSRLRLHGHRSAVHP